MSPFASHIVVLGTVFLSLVFAAPYTKRQSTYTPVLSDAFYDPSLININGVWWSFSSGGQFPRANSTDFQHWDYATDSLPEIGKWANFNGGVPWAPDVTVLDDGTYMMYYAGEETTDGSVPHCLGAASSKNIEGPYNDLAANLPCKLCKGGAYDVSSFHDSDGKRYIVWKEDTSCDQQVEQASIYIQQVAADGISLQGDATDILESGPSDQGVIEAPQIVRVADGSYVLFFAAGPWNKDYATGVAVSDSLLGPYKRAPDSIMSTDQPFKGLKNPGGLSAWLPPNPGDFTSQAPDACKDGNDSEDLAFAVFHADADGARKMYTATMEIAPKSGKFTFYFQGQTTQVKLG